MPLQHSIAAVARLTGLSADTLRAWERRYGIVSPERDASGIRRYSDADIARLQLVEAAVRAGQSLASVAGLSDAELRRVGASDEPQTARRSSTALAVRNVLAAIRRYDVQAAERRLSDAAMLIGPESLVLDILVPLLREIGASWEARRLSIAQEHLTSQLVRNLVGIVARQHAVAEGEPMVFATPPSEDHEFGISFAAALASIHGVRTCVLGPRVPAPEVVRAAEHLSAGVVVIGAVFLSDTEAVRRYVLTLEQRLAARVRIWVGGGSLQPLFANGWPGRSEFVVTLDQFARRVKSRRRL